MILDNVGYRVEYINYIDLYKNNRGNTEYEIMNTKIRDYRNDSREEYWHALKPGNNSKVFNSYEEIVDFLGDGINNLGYELDQFITEWHYDSNGIVAYKYENSYGNVKGYAIADINHSGEKYLEFNTYDELETYIYNYYGSN